MRYLPVFLDLQGRKAIVLGTGEVAERKAAALRRAGAAVTRAGHFLPDLLDGCSLAVGADAPEPELTALSQAAQSRGIPVNIVDRPALCSYLTPAIVDREPLIVAIGTGGAAPVLARIVRQRIEAMLPRSLARLAALAGSLKCELRARLPDPAARRRVLERMLGGRSVDLVDRGDDAGGLAEMRREIEGACDRPPGIVYLADAGPGAGDLLTLRAHRLLGEADVIVHDTDVGEEILELARRDAPRVAVESGHGQVSARNDVPALLVRLAREGKRVVRLEAAGPPGFADAIAAFSAADIAYDIVPGVTLRH